MSHLGNDPQTVGKVIESLGGKLEDDATFSFPVSQTREIVPKLHELGIGVRSVQQFVTTNPRSGKIENRVICKAYRKGTDG